MTTSIPNTNITVFYNKNIERVRQVTAHALSKKLSKEKGNNILLLISGGSALFVLDGIDNRCISSNVTIGVLDERYSKEKDVNIFLQLMRTSFYRKAIKQKCRFLDTRVHDGESFDQFTTRFTYQTTLWLKNNKKRVVIATQGMGSDGHTAGILPYPENSRLFHELFENSNKDLIQ